MLASTTGDGLHTRIGSHGNFLSYSHIAHDCVVGDHVIMANGVLLGGHATIGDRDTAADAVEMIVTQGIDAAMTKYNRRKEPPADETEE